jgi:hypothetical protein
VSKPLKAIQDRLSLKWENNQHSEHCAYDAYETIAQNLNNSTMPPSPSPRPSFNLLFHKEPHEIFRNLIDWESSLLY